MEQEIVYRFAIKEDGDAILEFLREHFYPDEPLTYSIEPKEQDAFDEKFVMDHLATRHSFCLLAFYKEQMISLVLVAPKGPDEWKILLDEAALIPGTKCSKLLVFLAELDKNVNVCEKFNVKKVMHAHILAVHKDFRRLNIAYWLSAKGLQITKTLGYPILTVDCSSEYSSRMVSQRLGMECINICNLEEYRAPGSNAQIFFPSIEHKYTKTYMSKL